jgi:tetratricopeptide (TPR) repeat protein
LSEDQGAMREFIPVDDAILLAERHRREGRIDEATVLCRRALQTQPDCHEAEHVLGLIALQGGRPGAAIEHLRRAAETAPGLAFIHANLSEAYRLAGRLGEAKEAALRALRLLPQFPEPLNSLASIALMHGELDNALSFCRQAIALKPNFAAAYDNLGTILKELGQLEEAEEACAKASQIDPHSSSFWANFAQLHRFSRGDPQLAGIEALAARSDLQPSARLQLDFALGKAYGDLGDHRRAFAHLRAGNAAKRALIKYDEESTLRLFRNIEGVFTPEMLKANSGRGDPATVPIFVVGMPRSGTTLVEQILASHPMVHGAGELNIFQEALRSVPGPGGGPILGPRSIAGLDAKSFAELGSRYLAGIRKLAPAAPHISDKMPTNFYFAGLIYLALPRARIIHVVRDPVDTCISCFSTLFAGPIDYCYDLGELARYYRHYEGLMAHWRRVLPAGHMLEVRYEDVVADQEGETRRMLAYCDLAWDPRCLEFHKTPRRVSTASAAQVRQPIYRDSIGRRRAYEEFIGPLLAELNLSA